MKMYKVFGVIEEVHSREQYIGQRKELGEYK